MSIAVAPRRQGLDAEEIRRFRDVGASTLGHLTEAGHLEGIRPLFDDVRLLGNVVTVKLHPPDGSLIRDALLLSRPGDVLVIECAAPYACWGELRTLAGLIKGLAGVVIDGPATDVRALRGHRLPVFCRGASALTTRGIGRRGEVNGPVEVAGVTVHPGDLALGDDDGLYVLSPQRALELLPQALDKEVRDEARRREMLARLEAGA